MGLAAALFFYPVSPALATELEEECLPMETTLPAETVPEATEPSTENTVPEETVPSTVETTAPTEETVPEETTAPTEVPAPEEVTAPTETTVLEETTMPTEPTVPEETTIPTEAPEPETVTVAQALALDSGIRNITIQGTVVFALGTQAVLLDHTGGIRLSFSEDPGIASGQVLLVTGRRSGGLFVSDFELLGTAALPMVEATLLEAPENVRVCIRNAEASGGYLQQQGFSLALSGDLPPNSAGTKVDAYGVILDGRFYADAIIPSAAPAAVTEAESAEQDWNLYFGLLHAHTDISDGLGSVDEAFQYASEVPRLDFFAVTDHSDSFTNANSGAIKLDGSMVSDDWLRGKTAAQSVTNETFVGIFGFEISWPEDKGYGHISTFNTPGWQTWQQKDAKTLVTYYDTLSTDSHYIGQFNHPDNVYGKFQRFANYEPEYDKVVHLIEVGGEDGQTYYDAYTDALNRGWHLAPANNQDNHEGNWGDASSVRTVVLAHSLSEENIYDAIRNYRVYATEDSDLRIEYRMNGAIMGSILGPTEHREITLTLQDDTDGTEGTKVEVISGKNIHSAKEAQCGPEGTLTLQADPGYPYYYLKITQPDGDIAVTAPIWVETYENLDIEDFSADNEYPYAGEDVEVTLRLYNDEWKDFSIEIIELLEDGQVLDTRGEGKILKAVSQDTYLFTYTRPDAGESVLQVRVTGTIAGLPRSFEDSLTLHFQPLDPQAVSIATARAGVPGQSYHVKGYVTAGNSNPYNTFPGTLYLQDDTGGLAVVGDLPSGVPVGAPLSVIGVLRRQNGNLVLDATKTTVPDETHFRFTPKTMSHSAATDYTSNGGKLIQVEGTLASLDKSGKSVSRFTLKDLRGDLVTVVIDSGIRSGAYGTNELAGLLKKGRTIRAVGLLHIDEYQQSVLRVRNCDEIVYVPPRADPTNPKTGDFFRFLQ